VIVEQAMTGGSVTLNNNSLLEIGTNNNAHPSASGGTVVYGTGVDSVLLNNISSGSNAVQLSGLNDKDSVGTTTPFDSASLSGNTLTLREGANTVATFNVTLAAGASHTFEPVTTEVIGGTTYYVATLDPPTGATGAPGANGITGATGAIGATGATGTSGTTGSRSATGSHDASGPTGGAPGPHHDPQSSLVTADQLLGPMDKFFGFLRHGVEQAFEHSPLSQWMNTLAHDLTNIAGAGVGPWTPDPKSGAGGWLNESGHSSSVGNLEQDSKPHGNNLLPPHH
jgi:hypothetical protein